MKKIVLELGGNDPLVIFSDGDIEKAVEVAIEQGLGTCGQRCTAVKRIFVEQNVVEKFFDILKPKIKALKIGDPNIPSIDIGHLIHENAAEIIEKRVNDSTF